MTRQIIEFVTLLIAAAIFIAVWIITPSCAYAAEKYGFTIIRAEQDRAFVKLYGVDRLTDTDCSHIDDMLYDLMRIGFQHVTVLNYPTHQRVYSFNNIAKHLADVEANNEIATMLAEGDAHDF